MPLSISFRCKACGEQGQAPRGHGDQIAGFTHAAAWLAAATGPDGRALLLEHAPEKGERHWLSVHLPFAADSDTPFWSLYQRPMAFYNGFDDQPQEIALSALIECRLVEIGDHDTNAALVRVEVLRSMPVPAIGGEPVVTEAASNLFDMLESERTWLSRHDRFSHVSFDVEGDAGCWAIVERRGVADFLLLHGDWSWHEDSFSVANRRLQESEAAILARIADRQERGRGG
jgi:hypothetical protein